MASFEVFVPGLPVPYSRTRSKGSQRYTDPKYRMWCDRAIFHGRLAARTRPPLEGPVGVAVGVGTGGLWAGYYGLDAPTGIADFTATVEAFLRMAIGTRPRKVRGDLDNYVKAVNDALQGHRYQRIAVPGVVMADDRQVALVAAGWLDAAALADMASVA